MIPAVERDMHRAEREAAAHRRQAAHVTAAWRRPARSLIDQPSLLLALVLATAPESLAHRATYLPRWAEISTDSAAFYRRRLAHYQAEAQGPCQPSRTRRTART
jgi:hypothetical protein